MENYLNLIYALFCFVFVFALVTFFVFVFKRISAKGTLQEKFHYELMIGITGICSANLLFLLIALKNILI